MCFHTANYRSFLSKPISSENAPDPKTQMPPPPNRHPENVYKSHKNKPSRKEKDRGTDQVVETPGETRKKNKKEENITYKYHLIESQGAKIS